MVSAPRPALSGGPWKHPDPQPPVESLPAVEGVPWDMNFQKSPQATPWVFFGSITEVDSNGGEGHGSELLLAD